MQLLDRLYTKYNNNNNKLNYTLEVNIFLKKSKKEEE